MLWAQIQMVSLVLVHPPKDPLYPFCSKSFHSQGWYKLEPVPFLLHYQQITNCLSGVKEFSVNSIHLTESKASTSWTLLIGRFQRVALQLSLQDKELFTLGAAMTSVS